jgi:hypothetical protein
VKKAAGVEFPVVAEVSARVEIEPGPVEVDPADDPGLAALDAAVLGNEVDDRAGRVVGRGRRRPVAHRFDAGYVAVGLDEGVGGAERDVAEQ